MGSRKPFWLWVWIMSTLIGMGILSACIPDIEQTEPIIVLDPIAGGPGTVVAVAGSGFPTETQVHARLGPPSVGATPQSYGDATTDADGSFALSFSMPAHWPDGTPIAETDLIVVVLNQDGSAKATAPFGYIPSSSDISTSEPHALGTHRQVVLVWHREGGSTSFCGDVVVYESGYVEIASCREGVPLERRLLSEDATDQKAWQEALGQERPDPAARERFRAALEERAGTVEFDGDDNPDAETMSVDSPTGGWLVRIVRNMPGWRAFVGGKEVPITGALGFFQGVRVPAGRSQVEFRYEPPSFYWGSRISAGAALALLVLLGLSLYRTRRQNP